MQKQYLRIAKKIYNEEQSFPSVYRELIKDIEPDLAIKIIDKLKKKIRSTKTKLNNPISMVSIGAGGLAYAMQRA